MMHGDGYVGKMVLKDPRSCLPVAAFLRLSKPENL